MTFYNHSHFFPCFQILASSSIVRIFCAHSHAFLRVTGHWHTAFPSTKRNFFLVGPHFSDLTSWKFSEMVTENPGIFHSLSFIQIFCLFCKKKKGKSYNHWPILICLFLTEVERPGFVFFTFLISFFQPFSLDLRTLRKYLSGRFNDWNPPIAFSPQLYLLFSPAPF